MRLKVVNNSRIKALQRCSMFYHFAYRERRRKLKSDVKLGLGTYVHERLAEWWGGQEMAIVWEVEGLDQWDVARANAMLAAYDALYRETWDHARGADTTKVEILLRRTIDVPLRREIASVEIAGTADGLIELDGELWLLEHKTSNEDLSLGGDYIRRLQWDSQLTHYFALEPRIVGVIYDVLKKPRLKPLLAPPEDKKDGTLYAKQRLTDEIVAEFYERCLVHILDDASNYLSMIRIMRTEEDQHREWLYHRAWIRKLISEEEAIPNRSSCTKYGRPCDYLGVCNGYEAIEDDMIFGDWKDPYDDE